MDVAIRVIGPAAADGVRELAGRLREPDELRGRVEVLDAGEVGGTLGVFADALTAALGPAGVGAFAAAVMQWLRGLRGDVEIEASRPDGTTFRLSARGVQGMTATGVRDLVGDLTAYADTPPAQASGDERP